jgi:aspartate/tyrosine/aromatic aminotransferase
MQRLAFLKNHIDSLLSWRRSQPKHQAKYFALLSNPSNLQQWLNELVAVCLRMNDMRAALRSALEKKNVPGDYSHIAGLFSFMVLAAEQSDALVKKHSIFMTSIGRISVRGITTKKVDYIAKCTNNVLRYL